MFEIKSYSLGSIQTNAVVVSDPQAKQLWCFDAPEGTASMLKANYPDYAIKALLLTHGHYDHILGVPELDGISAIYGSELDRIFFSTPQVMAPWMNPIEAAMLKPVPISNWLKGGESLDVAGLQVKVLPSPGHSQGGVIFVLPQAHAAIVGDTIFREGVGRTDLPGGSWDALEHSIQTHVYTLPDDMPLYPGHGPSTTVGHEKANNGFVRP